MEPLCHLMDDLSKAVNGAVSLADGAVECRVESAGMRKKRPQVAAPSLLELSKPEIDMFIRVVNQIRVL